MAENTLLGGDEMTQAYQACISSKDADIKAQACAKYKQLSSMQDAPTADKPVPFAEGGAVEAGYTDGGEIQEDVFSLFDEPVEGDMEMEDDMIEDEGETLGFLDRAITVLDEEQYSKLEEVVKMHPELPMMVDAIIMSVEEFEEEGMVEGPGDGTSDSIPAKLSDGEFVMTAKAVKQIGVDKLMKMMKKAEEAFDSTETSDNQEYACGGFVQRSISK